jgi:hypothetical protein
VRKGSVREEERKRRLLRETLREFRVRRGRFHGELPPVVEGFLGFLGSGVQKRAFIRVVVVVFGNVWCCGSVFLFLFPALFLDRFHSSPILELPPSSLGRSVDMINPLLGVKFPGIF